MLRCAQRGMKIYDNHYKIQDVLPQSAVDCHSIPFAITVTKAEPNRVSILCRYTLH
jgi:hypothetical protein